MTSYPNTIETFPFFVEGWSFNSKEEAWDRFKEQLKKDLYWIKGYKYWRMIPFFEEVKDFSEDEVQYRVIGRAFACETLLPQMKQISLDTPFKEQINTLEKDGVGYGLLP